MFALDDVPTFRARSAALLASAVVGIIAATPAAAEPVGPSRQAVAAHAEFLLGAPPPPQIAGICLVDTGVSPNPDTGAVVDRLALSGDPADQSPTAHGTRMAMHIAAPANGWGMVGIWPAARIVSVQASVPGQDSFTAAGYINAIKECDKVAGQYGVRVIELALSSNAPLSGDEAAQLADVVATARAHDLNVVAAAGNASGGPVGTPANVPGVFSVAAADGAGGLCHFASTGALLLAPGCGLDGANPLTGADDAEHQGESEASAIAAASLAALRSYRPDLTAAQAEQALNGTASPVAAGQMLNLAAAFTAQGLGGYVAPPPPPPPGPPNLTPRPRRLAKPRVTLKVTKRGRVRTLRIRVRNRPRGMATRVTVEARNGKRKLVRVARKTKRSAKVTIRVRRWTRVSVRLVDPKRKRPTSVARILTAAKTKRGHR